MSIRVFVLLVIACTSCLSFQPSNNLLYPRLLNSIGRSLVTRLAALPTRNRQQFAPPVVDKTPINEAIKAGTVRLLVPKDDSEIGEETMAGIMTLEEALEEARKRELDLVMINESADPPLCKVIDYSKYKYYQEKKKKENTKKQVKTDLKEIKMSYSIDQHDLDVRVKAMQKFIAEGDRVRVVVQFKGREMQYASQGDQLLQKIFALVGPTAVMDSPPKMEGRAMGMQISPKK